MAYDSNRSIAIILGAKRPLLALARHRSGLSRREATAACRLGPPIIRYRRHMREISADLRHLPP